MPSLKFDIIVDGNQGRVALQQFANETDAAFKRSEKSISRISLAALPEHEQAVVKVQRKYQALEAQIKQLETAGRISNAQAAKWHSGLASNMQVEIDSLGKLTDATRKTAEGTKELGKGVGSLTGNILSAAPAFAIATAAISGVYEAIRLGTAE